MPTDLKARTTQTSPEESSSRSPRELLDEAGNSREEDCSSSEETHAKMGFMLSKIAKKINPKRFAAHDSTRMKVHTNLHDDCMVPGAEEIPSRPGSSSSLGSATSNDAGHQSGLLWPYVSTRAHHGDQDSEHPLKTRRPALYEEYWADDPRQDPGQKRRKQLREC